MTIASVSHLPTVSFRGLIQRHSLAFYGLLAYGITWSMLLPLGIGYRLGMVNDDSAYVPLFILIAPFGPFIAALATTGAVGGWSAVRQLGRSILHWRIHPLWYAFFAVGIPLIEMLGMLVWLRVFPVDALIQGWPVYFLRFLPNMLALAILTGLAEEPGWRGLALPRLQEKWGPAGGTAALGLFWAGWHLPNLLFGTWTLETFPLWLIATLASAVVYTWVFNRTGSIFSVMLLHAAINTGSGLLFWISPDLTDPVALYGGVALSQTALAAMLLLVTRGRLGFRPARASHSIREEEAVS